MARLLVGRRPPLARPPGCPHPLLRRSRRVRRVAPARADRRPQPLAPRVPGGLALPALPARRRRRRRRRPPLHRRAVGLLSHRPLSSVVRGVSSLCSTGSRRATTPGIPRPRCTTDICSPVATNPTWTGLDDLSRWALEAQGGPLWHSLLETLRPARRGALGRPAPLGAHRIRAPGCMGNRSWRFKGRRPANRGAAPSRSRPAGTTLPASRRSLCSVPPLRHRWGCWARPRGARWVHARWRRGGMSGSRCFVQFSHPGTEHEPDPGGGKAWNTPRQLARAKVHGVPRAVDRRRRIDTRRPPQGVGRVGGRITPLARTEAPGRRLAPPALPLGALLRAAGGSPPPAQHRPLHLRTPLPLLELRAARQARSAGAGARAR